MHSLVIGLGETGQPLYELLSKVYDTGRVDPALGLKSPSGKCDVMNICIPYSAGFGEIVNGYREVYNPGLVINHSTVPVGTTATIPNAVHSPILGDHTNMKESIKKFTKWVGGERAEEAEVYLAFAGIRCRTVARSEETELLKLLCLAEYGKDIAYAKYKKELFEQYGFDPSHLYEWNMNYNLGVAPHLRRPLIVPRDGPIGGHCVIPGTMALNNQFPNNILTEVLKYS